MVMIAKKREKRSLGHEIYLILDNIRSVHNVGSIFRTADTLGIGKIYCLGTTPTPVDRFGRARGDFAKVSLGAEKSVAWEHVEEGIKTSRLITALKKESFKIIALEQSPKSVDYKLVKISERRTGVQKASTSLGKAAIILGNEVDGVSARLLKLADVIAEIPMAGKKESLNVSVSAGIFLYRLLDN